MFIDDARLFVGVGIIQAFRTGRPCYLECFDLVRIKQDENWPLMAKLKW